MFKAKAPLAGDKTASDKKPFYKATHITAIEMYML